MFYYIFDHWNVFVAFRRYFPESDNLLKWYQIFLSNFSILGYHVIFFPCENILSKIQTITNESDILHDLKIVPIKLPLNIIEILRQQQMPYTLLPGHLVMYRINASIHCWRYPLKFVGSRVFCCSKLLCSAFSSLIK